MEVAMDKLTLLFEKIWEMNLTASAVVLAARCFLLRFPKKYSYCLWTVVLFRLLCPLSITSTFSIFNFLTIHQFPLFLSKNTTLQQGVEILPNEQITVTAVPAAAGKPPVEYLSHSYTPVEVLTPAWLKGAACIWLGGIVLILLYSLCQYLKLHKKVETATFLSENIYECDHLSSPFVMGLFSPRIYIPYHLSEEEKDFILTHEKYHLRRLDHLVKPLAFFALTLHWFNPLIWLSYFLMCRDMEMSCDERVLSLLGSQVKKGYSTLLLSLSTNRGTGLGGPLAFGESDTGRRIRNVLHFRQPKKWFAIIGIIITLIIILGCATDTTIQTKYAATESEKEVIEITSPQIDLNATTGADGYFVYYMDEVKIIFGGYFGLFVYSRAEQQILRSVDVKAIGCDATQGDNYCEVFVAADGLMVYLHPVSMNEMYVYNVTENLLTKEPYDLTGISLYTGINSEDYAAYLIPEGSVGNSAFGIFSTLGEIGYVDENGVKHLFFGEVSAE